MPPEKNTKRINWRELEQNSRVLEGHATALSSRLTLIEEQLRCLPGKIEFYVEYGDDPNAWELGFARLQNEWTLVRRYAQEVKRERRQRGFDVMGSIQSDFVFDTEIVVRPLRDASVVHKSIAATLLPALVTGMIKEIDRRARLVKKGHTALDKLDEILAQDGHGGE